VIRWSTPARVESRSEPPVHRDGARSRRRADAPRENRHKNNHSAVDDSCEEGRLAPDADRLPVRNQTRPNPRLGRSGGWLADDWFTASPGPDGRRRHEGSRVSFGRLRDRRAPVPSTSPAGARGRPRREPGQEPVSWPTFARAADAADRVDRLSDLLLLGAIPLSRGARVPRGIRVERSATCSRWSRRCLYHLQDRGCQDRAEDLDSVPLSAAI